MLKKKKKPVKMLVTGVVLSAAVLSILIYYFFFYRSESFLSGRECSPAKHVLFISSYSESFETVALQKEGIRQAFQNSSIQLDIEYMDTKRFDTEENKNLFYQNLRYKLRNAKKYDVILLGDDAALEFGEAHQKELFKDIPMVFFCINDIEHAEKAGKNSYITGAVEEFYLKDTIDIAVKFQPEAKKIIAVYDGTLTGQGDEKQFYQMEENYPEYEFSGINSSRYTWDELGKELEKIPKDSIVIYMSCFQDKEGNQYTIPESARYIVRHTHVPVYRVSSGGVEEGLIGGKMVSYEKSGFVAASMAMEILEGESPADIPVVLEGESQYYFDYRALKKYGISISLVPGGAVITGMPQTFFEKYKKIMIPVSVLISVFLCVLLAAVRDSLRYRRLSKQLQSSHDELKETYDKLIAVEGALKQKYAENRQYTQYLEKKEEYIRYQAEHDYLTDLINRRAAIKILDEMIEKGEYCTVIIMDIDDFKEINDSFGHACGDMVLKEISRRFMALGGDVFFCASRLGGDEFLLVLKGTETKQISKLILQIQQIFLSPFVFEEKVHYIKASMGVAYFKGDAAEAGEIISKADLAMYTAKKSGKNECIYYNEDMKSAAAKRKAVKNILTEACQKDGFFVLYQPQVSVLTGSTEAYEALVRLKEYDISSSEFIPIAEETEIILIIGRIVTRKVIEQMVRWRERGLKLQPVALNFSSRQIEDKGYVDYLRGLLKEYDISPELIEIEITESIFIDNNERAMKLFKDFSSIGIRLAMDDFGTGYSSINYLTYIPVEKIKLDKSLVDIYLRDGKDTFIENIIRLAHCLGLKITVEGIEEKHQRDRLKAFKCDYIQGYYFSPPVTGEEVELLKNPIK